MVKDGNNIKKIVINNALMDFSKRCYIYKTDSVFHISYGDTVYLPTLDKEKGWIPGMPYNGIVGVNIIGVRNNKFNFKKNDTTTLLSSQQIPSCYVEKDRKLFYWYDKEYPLTDEAIAVFKKYDMIRYVNEDWELLELITNDYGQSVTYYFCRNDLSKYQRIISDFFRPPKLKCQCENE
jgi:hypothetical protein